MHVYISGALQASKDLSLAREKYEAAATVVEHLGVEVYLPHKYTDPKLNSAIPALKVFERDFERLLNCGVLVVFLDEPSLGVGAEIAIALNRGIEIIPVVQNRTTISRFVEGYLQSKNIPITRYANVSELSEHLSGRLRALLPIEPE